MFKFLLGVLVLAAAAAFFTVPTEKDAEKTLRDQLLLKLSKEDIKGKDAATQVAIMGCRLNPSTCYDLVRSGIDTSYENRVLYATFSMKGFDRKASCIGLFTTFVCPGGIQKK